MNPQAVIETLRDKLRILRRREFRILLLERFIPFSAVSTGVLLAALLVEVIFRLPTFGRAALLVLAVAGIALAAIRFFGRAVLIFAGRDLRYDDEHLASKVGVGLPHIRDRLVNVLQLARMKGGRGVYSPALVDAAIEKQGAFFAQEDFAGLASYDGVKRLTKRSLPYFIIVAAILLFSFESF